MSAPKSDMEPGWLSLANGWREVGSGEVGAIEPERIIQSVQDAIGSVGYNIIQKRPDYICFEGIDWNLSIGGKWSLFMLKFRNTRIGAYDGVLFEERADRLASAGINLPPLALDIVAYAWVTFLDKANEAISAGSWCVWARIGVWAGQPFSPVSASDWQRFRVTDWEHGTARYHSGHVEITDIHLARAQHQRPSRARAVREAVVCWLIEQGHVGKDAMRGGKRAA